MYTVNIVCAVYKVHVGHNVCSAYNVNTVHIVLNVFELNVYSVYGAYIVNMAHNGNVCKCIVMSSSVYWFLLVYIHVS